jgi:hypothetical protein
MAETSGGCGLAALQWRNAFRSIASSGFVDFSAWPEVTAGSASGLIDHVTVGHPEPE